MRIYAPLLLLTFCCLSPFEDAKAAAKAIAFLGEVQSVDTAHDTVTVKHGEVPGYAVHGTSRYSVENAAVLKSLHPGDDIRATVYPNDYTLHNIRIVYRHAK